MKICVFGLGYVGVVSAACLAELGHSVAGVDISSSKVDKITSGLSPIVEPGIQDYVAENVRRGSLRATTSAAEGLEDADVVFICVGTPSRSNGSVDLLAIKKVTQQIRDLAYRLASNACIIYRSTVPPGTMEDLVLPIFEESDVFKDKKLHLYFHPEFLREGSAVRDFFEAPQVVVASIGNKNYSEELASAALFKEIYLGIDMDFKYVAVKTAEMIKYVNNTFHALKVSFGNEIGRLCNAYSIDQHELIELFLSDDKLNISTAYLRPGFAYGGSCLPKDLRALKRLGSQADVSIPIIDNISESNRSQIQVGLDAILQHRCQKVGFLGISFKSNTDDVRESPYLYLVEQCIGKGLEVRIYDPSIDPDTLVGANRKFLFQHFDHIESRFMKSPDELLQFSDVVVVSHDNSLYWEALSKVSGIEVVDLTGRRSASRSHNHLAS